MASRSVNKVILIGHLGRDAETTYTTSGVARTRFSIATNRRVKDAQTGEWRDETDWANVVLWRQDNLAKFLTRGKQVYVEGRLSTRSYDDKKDGKKVYVTEVVAEDIILLGGRGESAGPEDASESGWSQNSGASRTGSPKPQPTIDEGPEPLGITDDDVPF